MAHALLGDSSVAALRQAGYSLGVVAAFLVSLLLPACGNQGTSGSSASDCPPGQSRCTSCSGAGFCSSTCPGFACPASIEGGADATTIAGDGGACPSESPTRCFDCGEASFCVAGSCPAIACPMPPSGDDAGASVMLTCTPDAAVDGSSAAPPALADPAQRYVVSGTNGVFADSCDNQGNLVEYSCETVCSHLVGPVDFGCSAYSETGRVVPTNVDCEGNCTAGRCDSRCPAAGQRLTLGSGDGGMPPVGFAVQNEGDGRHYICAAAALCGTQPSCNCGNGPASQTGTFTGGPVGQTSCAGYFNLNVSMDGVPADAGNASCFLDCRAAPGCVPAGQPCRSGSACCGGVCTAGKCGCAGPGAWCYDDSVCCSGTCNPVNGGPGTCQ